MRVRGCEAFCAGAAGEWDAKAAEIFQQTGSTAMVLVVVRGREVHFRSFGETAPGSGQLPQPDAMLRLCSLTKIFATDLLVKLMGDKSVRLDDPLERFAPAKTKVPTLTVRGAAARPMTLGDLATHTAGAAAGDWSSACGYGALHVSGLCAALGVVAAAAAEGGSGDGGALLECGL